MPEICFLLIYVCVSLDNEIYPRTFFFQDDLTALKAKMAYEVRQLKNSKKKHTHLGYRLQNSNLGLK